MMIGAAGMGISMLVMGTSLSFATKEYTTPAIAATVFIFVYNTFFALGWLGVTWVRGPEHSTTSPGCADLSCSCTLPK